MELLLLIVQVMVVCTIVAALTIGLLSAPWYVLVGLLLVGMVLTRRWMPTGVWTSPLVETPSNSLEKSSEAEATKSTPPSNLMYRGATYSRETDSQAVPKDSV